MKRKKIINIVGARPNLMKIAPIIKEMNKSNLDHLLLHTGQHYDRNLSKTFFEELDIPMPDINLNVGSDTPARQIAKIMEAFDEVCVREKPGYILVVGDVNSTVACSLVAAQRGIKIIHVEAGLRSRDKSMPEEINRLATDAIADYLLPPSMDAVENLLEEGHSKNKIKMVGNIMIDTLLMFRSKIEASGILDELNMKSRQYAALTLHRPANVDDKEAFQRILEAVMEIQKEIKIVFPVHPRTEKMIQKHNLTKIIQQMENLILTPPLGYFDFGKIISHSKFVLTDSGGIQEETTVYGIPCITLRENTERPVTITTGTNELAGSETGKIVNFAKKILAGNWKKGAVPDLWDGHAAERIVNFINLLNKQS